MKIRPIATNGFFGAIVDLLYKQGVSFNVLGIGYSTIPNLPPGPKCYTFGGFIDYFLHGSIAQMFGGTDLGAGNNVVKAVEGNSFAHSMSYIAKSDYLQGHGWGSSYLLETYVDFGWIGLILFSLVLGFALLYLIKMLRSGWSRALYRSWR